MKLPGHIAKRVRALLERFAGLGHKEAVGLLPYFQGTRRKPPSKLPKSLQSRRPTKAKIHKDNTRALRAAVMERAQGECEQCGRYAPAALQLDHWLSGSGQRRPRQSVQTTWMLCATCHWSRTANFPTAAAWNYRFEQHCLKYGYPFTTHVEHAPVPARSAT